MPGVNIETVESVRRRYRDARRKAASVTIVRPGLGSFPSERLELFPGQRSQLISMFPKFRKCGSFLRIGETKKSECALRELCLCGQYSFTVNPEEPRDPAIERIQVGTDAAGTKDLSDIPVIFLCLMAPTGVYGRATRWHYAPPL